MLRDAKVDKITHSAARISWTADQPGTAEVEFGPSPQLGQRAVKAAGAGASSLAFSLNLTGLRPDTSYYFRPTTRSAAGEAGTLAQPGSFRTLPLPADHPRMPEPPRPVDFSSPTIDGTTFSVRADGSDLQEQLDRAAKADPALSHAVVIPAGTRCVGHFRLPRRQGPGWVVVRSSAALPVGRVRPGPHLATLSAPGPKSPALATLDPTHYWRVEGLEITHEGSTTERPPFNWLVRIPMGSSHVVFDRVWVHGLGFPDRVMMGILLHADQAAVIHSRIANIHCWHKVDPATGQRLRVPGVGEGTTTAIEITRGNGIHIENCFLESTGITVFADGGTGDSPGPTDVVIRRNHFFLPEELRFGSPASNGRVHPHRQQLEFKRGQRLLIDGNLFENHWVDVVPPGSTIVFTPRGPGRDNTIQDVTLTNNLLINVAGGITVWGGDNQRASECEVSQRIRIANNLFLIDAWSRRVTGRPSHWYGGLCLLVSNGPEDLIFEHNTCEARGHNPIALHSAFAPGEGLVHRNNVFVQHADNNTATVGVEGDPGRVPPMSGVTARQRLDAAWQNWQFTHNLFVPGVKQSHRPEAWTSTDAHLTWSAAECLAHFAGLDHVWCATGATAAERLRQAGFADPQRRDFRLRADSPFKGRASDGKDPGVDFSALRAAQACDELPVAVRHMLDDPRPRSMFWP